MTLLTSIAFIIACFMLFACLVHLLGILWGAIVYEQDKLDYGRNFWDSDEKAEEITPDTLEAMKTHITPIEILPTEDRQDE